MTLQQPDVIRLNEDRWLLRSTYCFPDPVRGRSYCIPAGFEYDKASVPRAVWWLISPDDLGEVAPLVHDWCYAHGGAIPGAVTPYTRAEADALFNRHMSMDHVQAWKRRLAFRAVRTFGGSHWPEPVRMAA